MLPILIQAVFLPMRRLRQGVLLTTYRDDQHQDITLLIDSQEVLA